MIKNKAISCLSLIVTVLILFVANAQSHATETDHRIEVSVKKSYVFKTYLRGDLIKIHSNEGIVTLTGSVPDGYHKSMAEETVSGMPGVKKVNNMLVVTGAPASANSDAWLRDRVRSSLLFHRSVSYANTDVSVTDGKVTLQGKASSEAQKQLTAEYAKDVSGVKGVDNQMIVTTSLTKSEKALNEKVDDASITSQVRMSIMLNHGPDGFDTQVSTHDGIVTLSGTAKNQAEIDLATKRVSDIYGVKSVNNKMTIEVSQTSAN